MFKTATLSPMQIGRLDKALDREYRFPNGVRTLRKHLELLAADGLEKSEGDGMIEWKRSRFNGMDGRQQAAYEARLKAKRYFYVNGLSVPKIVYDAL